MKLAMLLSLVVAGPTAPLFAADPVKLDEGLIFHAPFDGSADARLADGDNRIYTAPPSRDPTQSKLGLDADEVTISRGMGRYGDALQFRKKTRNMVFFYADKNVGYRAKNWSGTISMWLSIDPTDLQQQFSDPVQITDKKYNDAAIWVDFTKDDTPPDFRLGVFADLNVWKPKDREVKEIPESELPIVRVSQPPFGRGKWTHVVITYSDFNSGGTSATASLYINGELQGTVKDRPQVFTWDRSKATIRVGLGYVGLLDELAIFNRALTAEEVRAVYKLPAGLGATKE